MIHLDFGEEFVKRFCRLTLAFSKKLQNLEAAVAMHIATYNFTWRPAHLDRLTGKATGKRRPTPAMAAGLVDRLISHEELERVQAEGLRAREYRL